MSIYRLAGLSGALRADSSNTKLVKEAARLFEPAALEMGDLNLPLYDGDIEANGLPESVLHLGQIIAQADALIISTPEYNKALSGVLKNALDWLSRLPENPLRGKPTAILSSAAGRAGGERAQFSLRLCLVPHGARVVTAPEVMIAGANDAFDADGHLKDEAAQNFLRKLMDTLKAEI